jgi:hypothetical protein
MLPMLQGLSLVSGLPLWLEPRPAMLRCICASQVVFSRRSSLNWTWTQYARLGHRYEAGHLKLTLFRRYKDSSNLSWTCLGYCMGYGGGPLDHWIQSCLVLPCFHLPWPLPMTRICRSQLLYALFTFLVSTSFISVPLTGESLWVLPVEPLKVLPSLWQWLPVPLLFRFLSINYYSDLLLAVFLLQSREWP